MIKIPAKIGIEMWILIALMTLFFLIPMDESKEKWISYAIFIFSILLFVFIIFTIKYYIKDGFLCVKNSFFGTQKIPIDSISEIRKTNNLVSSPAASISGRIQIFFGSDSVIISPKNYEEFKELLLRINPKIVFN